MKTQIITALTIFVLMFTGAWLLNKEAHESHIAHITINKSEVISNISTLTNNPSRVLNKFAPREYIRIINH